MASFKKFEWLRFSFYPFVYVFGPCGISGKTMFLYGGFDDVFCELRATLTLMVKALRSKSCLGKFWACSYNFFYGTVISIAPCESYTGVFDRSICSGSCCFWFVSEFFFDTRWPLVCDILAIWDSFIRPVDVFAWIIWYRRTADLRCWYWQTCRLKDRRQIK